MWRKPKSKQHKPSQAVVRTSRLFGTGLSPGLLLVVMIAIKNKTIDFKMVNIMFTFEHV